MYAIFTNGGKQYKAEKGKYLKIEKMKEKCGKNVIFNSILMIKKNNKTYFGTPIIDKSNIEATIVTHKKGKKIQIIKFNRRKHYKRKMGHRQLITIIKIQKINYNI
ncbi:50S ribosomal protein L21 [Buchnera aphidicola (Mollitrichosiphum nigrofasciatum)]|uniref:50S ribosomal protein L21 n=1 Tax=Buchnera aphidicola TaxID=9 RepID=UPI0031B8759A